MKRIKKIVLLILVITFLVLPLIQIGAQAKEVLPKVKIVSVVKSSYLVYEPISVTVNSNYLGKVQYRAYIKNVKTGKVYDVFTISKDKYSTVVNGGENFKFTIRATTAGTYQVVVMVKREGVKKNYESIVYSRKITIKDTKAAITNVSLKINGNKVITGVTAGHTFYFNLSSLKDSDRVTRLIITSNKDAKVRLAGKDIPLTAYQPKEISLSMLGIKDNPPEGATLKSIRNFKDSNGYLTGKIELYINGKIYKTYDVKAKVN
ncbi:RICIN domain-containing protein [Thermobrachium celere]|uniref:Uncharacterized protein n=1 Tax=Thermobrachium celere DSM 8682 TaxID=941824 RepID=R7RQZ0_9CLOT|nr:RICIN domain-containing protein [Thermobrachium celere]CDF57713.1 hypothetical protein TCEL_01627 [Thermobrachium celere DSM 8682]